MRLVTRCPACATTFKVVRDQLRISDGWVRCGRCSEVFDATLDLQETDDDGSSLAAGSSTPGASRQSSAFPPATQRPPKENLLPPSGGAGLPAMDWPAADLLDLRATPASPAPAVQAPAAGARPPASFSPAEDPVPIPSLDDVDGDGDGAREPWLEEMLASTQALQAALQSTSAAPEAAAAPLVTQRKEPAFTPALTTPSPIEEAVNAQLQKALRRERIKALRRERAEQKERERAEQAASEEAAAPVKEALPSPVPEVVLPDAPLLETPSAPASFMDGTVDAAPSGPGRMRKLLLALACMLALAALLLQVVREERNALAAREPRLRPALQWLCDWTGCQLSALRQINSITIEGASFSREKEGDGYRLVFALRNGARVPLAMPSIELTLLDTQQRALVRRVLSPAQFGAGPVLGPGAESNTSLPIQLSGSEAAGLGPVAGYNLVAFYP